MNQAELIIRHGPQNMGVPANKEIRFLSLEHLSNALGIALGVTSDVDHQDLHPFALELPYLRVFIANLRAVDIAPNGLQGAKLSQFLSQAQGADISRMPDLIALFEKAEEFGVEIAVSVGDETYSHESKWAVSGAAGRSFVTVAKAGRPSSNHSSAASR